MNRYAIMEINMTVNDVPVGDKFRLLFPGGVPQHRTFEKLDQKWDENSTYCTCSSDAQTWRVIRSQDAVLVE